PDVVADSPAARAGFQVGDIVRQFDGKDVDSAKSLGLVVAATNPDARVPVRVWRDGHMKTLQVRLGDSSDDTQAATTGDADRALQGDLGMSLANLNDEYRNRLGLPDDYDGVVVTAVRPDSSAAEQGLRPGDAISRIDTTAIHDLSDVARAVKGARKHGDRATLLVRRGDGQQFVSVAMS
ncbi:MAG TPA: PDZ domain-containing protein, partial [Woeseiaceae bacterium]|nr:PDZ domain-containing protein [Woeseiaceae bacterium]